MLQAFANLVMVDVLRHEDYNFEPNPALPLVLISVDSTDLQQATHDKTALSGQVLWVRTSGKTWIPNHIQFWSPHGVWGSSKKLGLVPFVKTCFGFVFHSVLLFFSHLYLVPPAWLLGWQGVHANVFPLKSALVGMTNESWPSYCLSKPCMSHLQHNQPFKSRGLCDQVFLWTFGFSLEAQSFVMVLQ